MQENAPDSKVLDLASPAPGDTTDLTIPLPMGIRSEDVRAENHYLSHQLWITLRTTRGSYDKSGTIITANPEKIREAVYVRGGRSELTLRFGLTGFYEPMTELAEGTLRVQLLPPAEIYRHVVLVDPESGNAEEQDIVTAAAQALVMRYADNTDTRVYLTRAGGEEQNQTLLKTADADCYIRIRTGDQPGLQIGYNETWYLRKYNNARFAYELTEAIVRSTGCPSIGTVPVGMEDPVLAAVTVPAAVITLGDPSDSADSERFAAPEMPEEIADGIAQVIEQVFAAMEEE